MALPSATLPYHSFPYFCLTQDGHIVPNPVYYPSAAATAAGTAGPAPPVAPHAANLLPASCMALQRQHLMSRNSDRNSVLTTGVREGNLRRIVVGSALSDEDDDVDVEVEVTAANANETSGQEFGSQDLLMLKGTGNSTRAPVRVKRTVMQTETYDEHEDKKKEQKKKSKKTIVRCEWTADDEENIADSDRRPHRLSRPSVPESGEIENSDLRLTLQCRSSDRSERERRSTDRSRGRHHHPESKGEDREDGDQRSHRSERGHRSGSRDRRSRHLAVALPAVPLDGRKERIYCCPKCPKTFNDHGLYDDHYSGVHLKRPNYRCTGCPAEFVMYCNLREHERKSGHGPMHLPSSPNRAVDGTSVATTDRTVAKATLSDCDRDRRTSYQSERRRTESSGRSEARIRVRNVGTQTDISSFNPMPQNCGFPFLQPLYGQFPFPLLCNPMSFPFNPTAVPGAAVPCATGPLSSLPAVVVKEEASDSGPEDGEIVGQSN